MYSVILDLFGTATSDNKELAHEFAVNFIYDFGRNIGMSDHQARFNFQFFDFFLTHSALFVESFPR